jgi:hypothetical protein
MLRTSPKPREPSLMLRYGGEPRRPTRGRGCTYCHPISLATPRRLLLRHGTWGYTSFRGCATASTERITTCNGPPPTPLKTWAIFKVDGHGCMRAAAHRGVHPSHPLNRCTCPHSNIIFPLIHRYCSLFRPPS